MDNRAISCHPPLLTLSNQTQHDRVPLARGGGGTLNTSLQRNHYH